jgi:PAS domain-containing protein
MSRSSESLLTGSARAHLHARWCERASLTTLVLLIVMVGACGGDGTAPGVGAGARLTLSVTGLPPLDPAREGRYELWFIDAGGGAHSAGALTPGTNGEVVSPIADARAVEITVEGAGAAPTSPSPQVLLTGRFSGGRAALDVVGAITQNGVALRERPGQFTMFSPSDNDLYGYPSHEESGVWLFNMKPSDTDQNDFYVRLAQLQHGWTYEGWMVRDYGSTHEVWLSYGKFVPDWTGALNSADDTGWGPFSGITDYATYRAEDFPGDDWISNPLGLPFPAELTLPLNLRERDGTGQLRWTHVISIEPATDKGEAIGSERPFFLRLYVDTFGDLGPGIPRPITMRRDAIPSGALETR